MAKNNPSFRSLLPLLVLLSLAFVFYAQTFGYIWTYDDFPVIVENAMVPPPLFLKIFANWQLN